MKNRLSFQAPITLSPCLVLFLLWFYAAFASAQQCPPPGSPLKSVSDAISDLQKNDRAPFGADCAYRWLSNYSIESSKLDNEVLNFFRIASDVQRRAAEKRYADPQYAKDGDRYMDNEISLRKQILEGIENNPERDTPRANKDTEIQIHLNYLVSALALRKKYEVVDETLGDKEPKSIHPEAFKVWLQAVWSCVKFDGNKTNLCERNNQEICKEKVKIFLSSVEQMKNLIFPPGTKRNIDELRQLTSSQGCLK
ncbi:hypothetical protein ACO0LC_11165 [Undibacterium sp. JH2W]|uniref:hypothetical protein n=1 Tax=Undibacterium sp. JH2W TaxID=3413037 RepID=UPI003BF259DB